MSGKASSDQNIAIERHIREKIVHRILSQIDVFPRIREADDHTATITVSAPQTPFFPDSLGRDQMLGLEIPGQEGLEVFDSGRGR